MGADDTSTTFMYKALMLYVDIEYLSSISAKLPPNTNP